MNNRIYFYKVENLAQNSDLVFEDLSKVRGRVIKNLRKLYSRQREQPVQRPGGQAGPDVLEEFRGGPCG